MVIFKVQRKHLSVAVIFLMMINIFAGGIGGVAQASAQEPVWQNINQGLSAEEGRAILVYQNTYLLGTNSGKLYSMNNANNGWTLVFTPTEAGAIRAVQAVPGAEKIYLFGNKNIFYQSIDGGANWSKVANLPSNVDVESVRVVDENRIYVALKDTGIFYTSNRGEVWENISGSLPKASGKFKIKTVYCHNDIVYVALAEKLGVYATADNGLTWQAVKNLNGLATDKSKEAKSFLMDGSDLYIGTKDGVWRTNDGLAAWEKVPGDIPVDHEVVSIVKHGDSLYAVTNKDTSSDIYEACAGDVTFKSIGNKPVEFVTSNFHAVEKDGDYAIIAAKNGAAKVKLITRQQEQSPEEPPAETPPAEEPPEEEPPVDEEPAQVESNWQNISNGLVSEEGKAIRVIDGGQRYLLGTKSGRVYSYVYEAGPDSSWSLILNTGINEEIRHISDLIGGNKTYVLGKKNSFWVSQDGGVTWADWKDKLANIQPTTEIESAYVVDENRFLISVKDTGIFYTTDGGSTWANISGNLPLEEGKVKVKLVYCQDGKVYAGMNKLGLYVAHDYNGTWTPVKDLNGLSDLGKEIRSLLVEENRFVIGTKDGVWQTTDQSATWEKIAGIPVEHEVVSLLKTEQSIYAVTKKGNLSDVYEAPNRDPYFEPVGNRPADFVVQEFFTADRHGEYAVIATKTGAARVKLTQREVAEQPPEETEVPVEDVEIPETYSPGSEYETDLSFSLLATIDDLVDSQDPGTPPVEEPGHGNQDNNTPGEPGQDNPQDSGGSSRSGNSGRDTGASNTGVVQDAVLRDALEKAKSTGQVTLQVGPAEKKVALTPEQIDKLLTTTSRVDVKIGDVAFSFAPAVLKTGNLQTEQISNIRLEAEKLSPNQSREAAAKASNREGYTVHGDVFHLSVLAVGTDRREQAVTLNGSIRVVLPVPAEAREAAKKGLLVAGRLNEHTNLWEEFTGTYNSTDETFLYETNRFSKWALLAKQDLPAKTKTFTDIQGHWAQKDIEYMSAKGYINGMGSGLFAPNTPVTRAQFAAMLANVLRLTGEGEVPFKDVLPGQWYTLQVKRSYAAGLINGMDAQRFAPHDYITREQMAAMICNALRYKGILVETTEGETLLSGFSDHIAISGWAKLSAAQAIKQNILKGKPRGHAMVFAPRDKATRAEATVMLNNLLKQWE